MRTHSTAVHIAKRALDIALATVMIVALLPAMLFFAILVKLDSDGPIFYSQIRVGENKRRKERRKNDTRRHVERPVVIGLEDGSRLKEERRRQNHLGRPFPVLKFRTMVVNAEANGAAWAQKNDPRITRLGRILRKTHLDELPQLINILRGEMSFVGPRPERPEFVQELTQKVPGYHHRLALKPGLTGLAQIRHRADLVLGDVRKKVRYDLLYLKNASVLTDLKIILGTVPLMFGISVERMRKLRRAQPKFSSTVLMLKAKPEAPKPPASRSRSTGESPLKAKIAVILALAVLLNGGCATNRIRPLAGSAGPAPSESSQAGATSAVKTADTGSAVTPQNESKLGRRVSALIMKSEMRLGPEDMIEVRVKDHPELTAQVPIDPWGFIKLPYVQSLQVAGLTEDMVEDILTQKYSEFFRQPPEVEVTVLQYNSQSVYVLGAVYSPGRYPLVKGHPMTLRDVMVAAGLPTSDAALWRVWVVRQGDPGKEPTMRYIDLYKILYRGRLDDNIQLAAGDIVYVPFTILDSIVNFIGRIAAPITGAARRVATSSVPTP